MSDRNGVGKVFQIANLVRDAKGSVSDKKTLAMAGLVVAIVGLVFAVLVAYDLIPISDQRPQADVAEEPGLGPEDREEMLKQLLGPFTSLPSGRSFLVKFGEGNYRGFFESGSANLELRLDFPDDWIPAGFEVGP